ncbi:MAG: PEP-CTERM sorting domain-containing protein [Planctomycetota bacterium]
MSKTTLYRYLFGFGLLTAAVSTQAQQFYQFEIVAQDGDIVDGLQVNRISNALINDNGEIAYSGSAPGSVSAVWSSTSVLLAEGQDIGGGVILPDFALATFDWNNNGVAAVSSGSFSTQGVYSSAGVSFTGGDTIGGATISPSGNFQVNVQIDDGGALYFIAQVETSPGVFADTVFSSTAVLAQEGQTIGGVLLDDIGSDGTNGLLKVDDAGNVVFYNDVSGDSAIISTAGFALEENSPFPTGPLAGQTITDLSAASFAPGVNGQGDLVVDGRVGGVSGLYSFDGLVSPESALPFADPIYFSGADLNDSGTFVSEFDYFDSFDSSFVEGIVVDETVVITELETIGGFAIDDLVRLGSLDLNNNGDFVFVATLLDGGGNEFNAVIRATIVPEPTSLALLGLGGLIVARRRR